MSEPEKSRYPSAEEEQNEEVIQEGAEARAEQEVVRAEAIRSTGEEEQITVAEEEKVQKQKQLKKKKIIGRDEEFQQDKVVCEVCGCYSELNSPTSQ